MKKIILMFFLIILSSIVISQKVINNDDLKNIQYVEGDKEVMNILYDKNGFLSDIKISVDQYGSCQNRYCTSKITIRNNLNQPTAIDLSKIDIGISGSNSKKIEYYDYFGIETFRKSEIHNLLNQDSKEDYTYSPYKYDRRFLVNIKDRYIFYNSLQNITNSVCVYNNSNNDIVGSCTRFKEISEIKNILTQKEINHTYILKPGETKELFYSDILDSEKTTYKYFVYIDIKDIKYIIDPYFITTSSNFSDGYYNRTMNYGLDITLNNSFILREYNNNKNIDCFYDNCINMSKNIFLVHLNNESFFGENSTNVRDFSGNGINGTPNNKANATSSGKISGSYTFDGTTDYINFTNSSLYHLDRNITIIAWIKTSDANGGIVGKWDSSFGDPGQSYLLFIEGGRIASAFNDADTSANNILSSRHQVNDNTWKFVATTIDTGVSSNNQKIYINGIVDNERTMNTGDIRAGTGSFLIGCHDIGSTPICLSGSVDEVSVWNKSLSKEEILRIYKTQVGNYYPEGIYQSNIYDTGRTSIIKNITYYSDVCAGCNLPDNRLNDSGNYIRKMNMTGIVGLWHLDNNVIDYSGNGFNGTVSGAIVNTTSYVVGNSSYYFDGDNDFIDITQSYLRFDESSNKWTVSIWVQPKNQTNATIDSFLYMNQGSCNSQLSWGFTSLNNGGVQFEVGQVCVGANNAATSSALTKDIWTHLVGMFNGTHVFLYVNGQFANSVPYTFGSIANTAGTLYIGADPGAANRRFGGNIDEVAIWNRTLTEQEISDLYLRGSSKINITARSCVDSSCNNSIYTQNISGSFSESRFFQYRLELSNMYGLSSIAIRNITVGYDNFTIRPNQSIEISREYSTWTANNLPIVLAIGIICFLLLFIAFNWNKDGGFLLFLLCCLSIFLLLLIPSFLVQNNNYCSMEISNKTLEGNTTSYSYNYICLNNTQNTNQTFHKAYLTILIIFSSYILIYLIVLSYKKLQERL